MKLKDAKIMTAMVTPFDANGQVDPNQTVILVEYLLANGTEGLIVGGTTGEASTLTKQEKVDLYQHVVEIVNGRVPIIAGTGTNNTAETIAFTQEVAQIPGIDAALVVVPYYNKPNQAGLYAHFEKIASVASLPILLYNVPSRTGVSLTTETTIALAKLPNIIGIKECGGVEMMSEIIANTESSFLVYSGEDALSLPTRLIGGTGVISVASHVLGNEMQQMYQAYNQGDLKEAGRVHRGLLPKMATCFMVSSPAPVKMLLNHAGIQVGGLRLPMVACTDEESVMILNKMNQSNDS
ncbi:4-hydroxy-tetrahydrodipicolinate synthase [Isobaculum melis]|uniref:4-hydroxy-tetrahydrodipicolinate synthase n=1 Tax=Isobaculum melis TaxID=142588 RepID=UPI000B83755E|nr:4-hydroxy-tetrahydrodipicolinate synthase [Isobaculum melis]